MTIEAAPQPSNFTATFEIIINGIRTVKVGDLTNVIKQVDWTLKGTENSQSFELPQKTIMHEPDADNFVPLASVTSDAIIAWIETVDLERLPGIKAHIQYVLDKMIAEASAESTPLPWLPVADEPEPAPI